MVQLSTRGTGRWSRPWSRLTSPFTHHSSGVTILTFAPTGADAAASLSAQLEHLAAHARVITLDEAVRGLSREDQAVADTVVLTFDDGSADFVTTVLPMLVRHHLAATLYLGTAFVEERRQLPSGAEPMSWSAVGEAAASGLVTVGSHAHTRRPLDKVSDAAAHDEVQRSIDLLARRLGRPPLHFAYPDDVLGSLQTRALVDERFRSATVGRGRLNPIGRTDLHRLVRTAVPRNAGADEIDAMVRPAERARR